MQHLKAKIKITSTYKHIIPDLGAIGEALTKNGLSGIAKLAPRPGFPFSPEKLQVWSSVESAIIEWGTGPYVVQPKYRGEELVIHFNGDKVLLFDRKGENVTPQFADIYEECLQWHPSASCIMDSEVVAIDAHTGEFLGESSVRTAKNHVAYVFDLIILDGKKYFNKPYSIRRSALLSLVSQITNRRRVSNCT